MRLRIGGLRFGMKFPLRLKETKLVFHPAECNIEFLLDRQLELALFNLGHPAG
jgi:hypothetical protein